MREDVFEGLPVGTLSDEVMEFIRMAYTPVFSDEQMTMYLVEGFVIIDAAVDDGPWPEPPEAEEQPAVEVGFDMAEVFHLMHEGMYSLREVYLLLKEGMYSVGKFTERHYRAVEEAHELLERYRKEYLDGESWEDAE